MTTSSATSFPSFCIRRIAGNLEHLWSLECGGKLAARAADESRTADLFELYLWGARFSISRES